MCADLSNEIKSVAECKKAATELALEWGGAWNGPNDFPRCLYAEAARKVVHFNLSPNPAREDLNPNYSAICRTKGTQLNM